MTKLSTIANMLGGDMDLAMLLGNAGLNTPRKIRKASDGQLLAIRNVGADRLQKIREKMGRL